MELEVAIVMMGGLCFLTLIAAKVGKSYFNIEMMKHEKNSEHQAQVTILKKEIEDVNNSNRNYIYKIRKLRDNFDLDFDDVEYNEEEDEDFRLSELAKSIYPKLPDSLGKLIDKEEFQTAILKTAEKNPDIITKFVDKFLNKTETNDSSKAPALTEKYL